MYQFWIFLGVLAWTCLASTQSPALPHSSTSSSSETQNDPIGEFTIIATAKEHGIILSNNVAYKPTSHRAVKISEKWLLNDTIRLLKADDKHRFILINLRTGRSIKAKILDYISDDSSTSGLLR